MSKQNPISKNQLPKGWEWKSLDYCVDILDHLRVPVNSAEREKRVAGKNISELIPYYGATQQNGFIDDFLFDEELVLLGEDGVSFHDKNKHKAYLIFGKSWVNNHAHVLKAKKGISINQFICNYLNTYDYTGIVAGATRLKLTQNQMRTIQIPLPPLPEQVRIVARLDNILEHINKAIVLTEQNLEHSRHLLPAALNKIILELQAEKVLLTEVCELNPPKSEVKTLSGLPVSFVPMADLNEKKMFFESRQAREITEVYSGYTFFKENDVLLAKVTPCFENGKSGIARNLTNGIGFGSSEYYVFRPKEKILPEWIYYNISASEFISEGAMNMSGAVGLKRVTKEFINRWKVKLPSLSVQKTLVEWLNKISAEQQQLIIFYTQRLQHLQKLKASVLDAAFRGEL